MFEARATDKNVPGKLREGTQARPATSRFSLQPLPGRDIKRHRPAVVRCSNKHPNHALTQ